MPIAGEQADAKSSCAERFRRKMNWWAMNEGETMQPFLATVDPKNTLPRRAQANVGTAKTALPTA